MPSMGNLGVGGDVICLTYKQWGEHLPFCRQDQESRCLARNRVFMMENYVAQVLGEVLEVSQDIWIPCFCVPWLGHH